MDIEEEYDKIYRFCYYRTGNRTIAEDLTQETFLRFLTSSYQENGKRLRYLYAIARNLCIEEARRLKIEELIEDIVDDRSDLAFIEEDIMVREALMKLDSEDRDLVILRYMNEEPMEVLCQITGQSRFALHRRFKRTKEAFIKLMEGG